MAIFRDTNTRLTIGITTSRDFQSSGESSSAVVSAGMCLLISCAHVFSNKPYEQVFALQFGRQRQITKDNMLDPSINNISDAAPATTLIIGVPFACVSWDTILQKMESTLAGSRSSYISITSHWSGKNCEYLRLCAIHVLCDKYMFTYKFTTNIF